MKTKEWWYSTIQYNYEHILDLLPTGSGLNNEWECTKHTPGKQRFINNFYVFNEAGFHVKSVPVSVNIYAHNKLLTLPLKGKLQGKVHVIARPGDIGYEIKCRDYLVKEYLYDIIGESLDGIITRRSEVVFAEEIGKY